MFMAYLKRILNRKHKAYIVIAISQQLFFYSCLKSYYLHIYKTWSNFFLLSCFISRSKNHHDVYILILFTIKKLDSFNKACWFLGKNDGCFLSCLFISSYVVCFVDRACDSWSGGLGCDPRICSLLVWLVSV